MTKADLRVLLERSPSLSAFFRETVVDAIPWIFGGSKSLYDEWRNDVADATGFAAHSVFLVGSAAFGYSLSPYKAGRQFKQVVAGERYPSDIDIAVVDASLFTLAWDEIVGNDRRRVYKRIVSAAGYRGALDDALAKIRFDIYHGTVTDIYAPPGSVPAARLRTLFATTTRRNPFRGHRPRARLYRRIEDFLEYHEQSLKQLLTALRTPD